MVQESYAVAALLLATAPYVVILTRHQRRMAELARLGFDSSRVERELELLRRQVQEMRDLQYHHTIAIEGALRALRIPPEEAGHRERS